MREVILDGERIAILGSPITLKLYTSEFSTVDKDGRRLRADLVGDFAEAMQGGFTLLPQILWAMIKTVHAPSGNGAMPGYAQWFSGHAESLTDYSDEDLWEPVIEEASHAFFRKAAAAQEAEHERHNEIR